MARLCVFVRCARTTATYDLSTKIKSLDINLVVSEAHLNFCSTQTCKPSSPCPPRSFHLSLHRPPVGTFVIPFGSPGVRLPFTWCTTEKEPFSPTNLALNLSPSVLPSFKRRVQRPARGIRVANFYSVKNPAGHTTLFSLSSGR